MSGYGYQDPAIGGPRMPRYAHIGGPAAGNSHVQDEAVRRGNSPGGRVPYYPVGTQNTRRPFRSQFAVEADAPNDQNWVKERHAWVHQGTERTGRDSGLKDPMTDGPARPSLRMLTRVWRKETGTDATRNYDPHRPQYRAVGWQDGSNTRIWGGTPGYFQEYGQRGSIEAVDSGSGAAGRAVIPGTVPHGLHTHTIANRVMTFRVYDGTPQMKGPRQDRISNSLRAGQTYSQTTVTQGGA
jgi:hypothetical protein